ncbi:SusC/RagA family TonB-linked outer membrane protein [Salinibacter ruber]|uniref:SusC/RagA family TonB-linked outer membrane protein n=1 Tax=Salinibacter ruber TaxID=146919 RepID=UPI000E577EA3|nr:SusC/RagA family TonB-linked outer membrane protein [Salinibacter ruber]
MKRLIPSVVFGLALLLLPGLAWAQQGTVTGTVTEAETGSPLPGATVQIVDEGSGAASDAEGQYRIAGVPAGEQTLRVSFVGYQAQERTVNVPEGGTVRVNFQLQTGEAQLEEVTVSAYRPETDRVATGADATVSGESIETADLTSAEGALQGRASGVRVTSLGGQPGSGFSIQVRGALSVNAGSDPLYIVDGVQINKENNLDLADGNPLSTINPGNIESIQVLKDAAAASIYGAQAANGVVVIETKEGRSGDTQINFSTKLGSVSNIEPYGVMDSEQYLNFRAEALDNASRENFGIPASVAFGSDPQTVVNGAFGPDSINTDWTDQVFREGFTQSYNLSLRGGSDDTQFYISGNFTRDEGQVIDSNFRRGGLRLNLNHQPADFLNLSAKTNLSTTRYQGTISDGAFINSPFWAAYNIPPTSPVYTTPGDPSTAFNLTPNSTFSYNPVAQEKFNTRESSANTITSNVTANWDLPAEFAARTFVGVQYVDTKEFDYGDPRLPPNAGFGGDGFNSTQRDITFNVSQTLSYENTFASVNTISALAGAEIKRNREQFTSGSGEGFPNELFRTLASAANPTDVSSFSTQYRQISYFGNATYTFDNTYQIGGTLRRDANSRFGVDNQSGIFGTVSGFWRISNESFLEDTDVISNLKLRASYGVTGNSDIDNFQSRQQFSGSGEYNGTPGIRPTALGNPSLTWEEKVSTNVGLDYGFFGGRITGSVDVFRDDREELLLFRDLSLDSGFGSYLDNVGEIRVEGLDFSVSTINLNDWNGLTWETNFNISFQRTEVRSLLPGDDEVTSGGDVYRVGEPAAQLRYTRYAGANPANGRPMYLDANGDLTYVGNDTNNEKLIGNLQPDFYGGFGNTISYKGLQVSAFFQYDYGRKTLNNDRFFADVGYFPYNKAERLVDNRWKEPGDVTESPAAFGSLLASGLDTYADGTDPGIFTTRFVENASYIRLKEVKVSYTLPKSLTETVGSLRNVTVFVQGSNLATWTNYTGPDPELVGTGLGNYPQARTLTAGLDLGL